MTTLRSLDYCLLAGIVFSGILLSGCGGSDAGDANGTTGDQSSIPLTNASTMTEFGSQIEARYGSAVASIPGFSFYLAQMDKSISDDSAALAFTGGNPNPLAGRWTNYAMANYPSSNGKAEFTDSGSGRQRMRYQDLDLTNQSTATGGAQAFYGVGHVSPLLPGSTSQLLTFVAAAEVIVTDQGRAQYRALKYFQGKFSNYTPNDRIGEGWYSIIQGVQSAGTIDAVPQWDGRAASLCDGVYILI